MKLLTFVFKIKCLLLKLPEVEEMCENERILNDEAWTLSHFQGQGFHCLQM
jgi:hypothetical protein